LTAAQGLARHPRLLMLDEPSAGLSPVLVDRVLNVIAQLRTQGTAVLQVEQLLEKVLASADRVYALVQGHIVLDAPTNEANLLQRLEPYLFRTREPDGECWVTAGIARHLASGTREPRAALPPLHETSVWSYICN
jgi:ABC-type multidrug transport system ATPase subunit